MWSSWRTIPRARRHCPRTGRLRPVGVRDRRRRRATAGDALAARADELARAGRRRARSATRAAAAAAAAALPGARIVLRGDSTLRGHLVRGVPRRTSRPSPAATHLPLVLVPALPAAGRVTRDGQHCVVRDGAHVALDETEYARDPDLGYSTPGCWTGRRSARAVCSPRSEGLVVPLGRLRDGRRAGGRRRHRASRARARRPPWRVDAETDAGPRADRRRHPAGAAELRALRAGAGRRAGGEHRARVRRAAAYAPGTLVVCGSWVPLAARQLASSSRRTRARRSGSTRRRCSQAPAPASSSAPPRAVPRPDRRRRHRGAQHAARARPRPRRARCASGWRTGSR